MGRSNSLSICVLLVISVLWKTAISQETCSLACKGSPTTPGFLNGHKYTYGVEGTVSIYLTGADKQETSVKLLGQATVTALGNCVNELKVQNLVISGPDGKKYGSPPGIDKVVQFTLEDGRIGSEICAQDGDTRRSLNIKRAIITLLQTEDKSSTQTDVFGACPTEVSSSKEGGAVLLHRTRDLSRCAHREQGKNDLVTAVYNPTAEIKSTQVLQSILNVESKLKNGVPEKVSASEEYLYKPFSVGENGARAKVHTKVTLTGTAGGQPSGSHCTKTRTIIFENPHGAKVSGNVESALNTVRETAKSVSSEASSKSAGEFAQLVRILRTVGKEDLIKIYSQVKGNNVQKRVFLDALLRTGTGYSVEASIEILKNHDLSDLEQKLVFLSLGNAQHVNSESIKAATSLLDMPNIPKELYLGVGALAGAYCRSHNCHIDKSDGVVALSQMLAAKLQSCRPKTKVEEDSVVAILKGIRNIRHLEDNLIDKLVRCANDNNVKARVRVAALEAFGADPCAAKLKKVALDLLKNRQQDSEIRIKAYLAIIECPCTTSASEIKKLLDTEPVHQVGRFITSSLRYIRSSSNPDKYLARQHYGQIRTPNKFNADDRKYSVYREMSYNIDALGIGGSSEETVIFSQDSFLPRSASLNITAELFGHNVNLLEVGGRQGNLDRVVEQFLGPKSVFRTKNPQDLYDDFTSRFKDLKKKAEGDLSRGRRSVKSEIDNFDKHLKAQSTPYNYELDLDIYVKLFGTDAVFLSLGDDKGINLDSLVDKFAKCANDCINKAKNFQEEVRGHLLFIDAQLAYPTSTGLPLKLDLVGAATGRFKVATKIDLRQIFRDPKNAKVDFEVIPSSDVEIAGLFLVDADAVATGLKVVTNLHSSTGTRVVARVLENGQGFDITLGLPIDKQEILTASNDLVFVTAEKGKREKQIPLKVDSDRKEYSACFDQLSDMLGLTLCGEVSVPFSVSGPDAQTSISKFVARYPLTGSSKIKVVLEKNDLQGYHVKGVLRTDNFARQSFELLFEAEGSKPRRTSISGELIRTEQEKTISLALESPIKSVSGQLSYYNKPNERVALLKAKLDSAEYFARAGFNVQGNERRSVYSPVIEYQLPGEGGRQSMKVDGHIVREVNGPVTKYSFEGMKINVPSSNEVVDVNGHFTHEPKGLDLDLKARKGDHNLMLSGAFKGSDVKLEFQNTLNPFINFKLNGRFENMHQSYHNDIELFYGTDLSNRESRVNFNQLLKYHVGNPKEFSFITKNKFEIHALPFKVKLEAEVDPKKLDIEIGGVYEDRSVDFDLEARTEIKKPGDYSVKVIADVDRKGLEVFAKRDIVSPDKSNLENYIIIKGIAKYELSGVVLHRTKPNDVNVGAVGHLKISGGGKDEDIKFDIGAIENSNLYSSHAKLSGSKGEYLDYLLKITRGANANGVLKFILKDTIAANGQYKVTDNDGKGNGILIIDFKKSQRKIKGDLKFVVKDPVYNVEGDVFMNFEKDNSDKLHFYTNTKKTEKLIDSKNKVEYGGKATELNFHHDGPMFECGKSHANVEIVLPTDRCLTFKLNQDVTVKDEVFNGNVEYVLSDAIKRGGQASVISFKSKIVDTNFEKETIDVEGQFELRLKDGKNLENIFYLKNVVQDDKYKFDLKTDVKGNLIPKPASLLAVGEGINKLRLKGNYGDHGFEYTSLLELKLDEDTDKLYKQDEVLTMRLPFENAHDIKVVSNVLYIVPKNKDIIIEFTVLESMHVNGDFYKLDTSAKWGTKDGFTKVKLLGPHMDPLMFDVNYKSDTESEKKRCAVEMKSQYGKGKTATITVAASGGPQDFSLLLQASAPQAEKLKNLEFTIEGKNPSPESYNSKASLKLDGQAYSYDTVLVNSKVNPVIDFKFQCPNSGPGRVYLRGTGLSSSQGKLEIKIQNIRDINLDASSEASIQGSNVAFKVAANSEKLGLKNYKVDIVSKDAGSSKRLEFHAVNDNKNILSGSTTFISKQEGPKSIIEGSGSVTVKNEQKSANFKYIRTILTEGNENGVETFLNLAIGERSYVAESRVTNLEYKNSYVYCEEKKQCANVEIQSKLNVPKPGVFQHLVNVLFDLRKLGFAPEFGLQISSEVSEKKLPQYTLDLHVNKDDKKYYLHVYSQPAHGRFPAGITVTLPQRVLALECLVNYPTEKSLPFPMKGELVLHLDKNKPHHKSSARFLIDGSTNEREQFGLAEFGFSHPKLGKEACMKIQGKLLQPDENSIKFESSASVAHPTIGDRESKVYFEANPAHIKLFVSTPVVKIIDLEGTVTLKDSLQQGDLKFNLLEGKPVQVRALMKEYQYFEFSTAYSDETQRKLTIISHIEPEKRVDFSADIVLANEKKNLAHVAVFLQDNLVKTDYGLSKDNIKYFAKALEKDLHNLEKRTKDLEDKASKDFKNMLQRVEPTYQKLEQAYKEDLQKLYDEVINDKTLKEISEALSSVVHFLAKMIDEVVQVTKPLADSIVQTVKETTKKILDLYEKQVEPQFKQLYDTIVGVLKEYFEGLTDIVAHIAALVSDFFEKHKPELEELTNTLTEIFKDLTRLVVAQLKEIRGKLAIVLSDLTQQIKDLPIFAIIKEKYQDLAVPDQVLNVLHDAHNALRAILPTDEARNLADALYNYICKKLRQEKVDDNAELRVVYEKFVVALTSMVQFVRAQLNQYGVPTFLNINAMNLISGPGQTTVPALGGVPTLSILTWLLRGDVPDPVALLKAYRPRSVNPLDEIPSKLRAVVVNGQHIFTFDGRHLTFPGNCRYVLAHDHVDRNFSLVLQLQNGNPKALVLEDKSGVTIELKDNGQVALDGASHGFPVIEKDVFAFREPNGRIGLGSTYGLMAFCTTKLEVCYIEVSGFYLGKLRGLLGDGNNEPFDDFRMPNGKITTSESEFGNSYRLAGSCPQVKTPEHSHHQHHAALPPACEQVFGGTSPLRPLSLILDVAPFRQACIHAVAGSEDALHQACDLARGYTALAVSTMLPAVLPDVCVRCTDTAEPHKVGDEYELKLPNKQADIIVSVEVTKSNEKNYRQVVVPLVSQLVDVLKSKHISDIKVFLVGITPKMPYPIIYDTDLKLKNPKVKFTEESRYKSCAKVKTDLPYVDHIENIVSEIVDAIRVELGLTNVVAGYNSILQLPLRPGAVKHNINVVGEHCKKIYLTNFFRAITYGPLFEEMGYTHSLVTVPQNLNIGSGKAPNQIVGFTENSVLMLGDKRPGKDAETLRQSLEYQDDGCIDFVESTDGLVLAASNYLTMNPGEQKQFLQTATAFITHKMLSQKLVQECTCGYVDPFRVRSICFNKDRKETAYRRK